MTFKTLSRLFLIGFLPFLVTCSSGNLGLYLFQDRISGLDLHGPRVGIEPFNAVRAGLDPSFEVSGYLPWYEIKKLERKQTENLTDLVYFSTPVNSDGTLPIRAPGAEAKTFLHDVRDLYGVRILQGVSDHRGSRRTEKGLATIVHDPELRKAFRENLLDYLVRNGFDGVDIDWEYPRTEAEKAHFTLLLQELRSAFEPFGLRLSIAVSPNHLLEAASYRAVDRIHLMAYDDEGRHSTYTRSKAHIRALLAAGAPADKLLLGVPFYGRGTSGRTWKSALTYRSIRERFSPAPRQDLAGGYYFNGIDTIKDKVRFAQEEGLAGVMIWEIGQDTADDFSLLKSISRAQGEFKPELVRIAPPARIDHTDSID